MSDLEVYHKTAVRLINGEELYRSVEDDPYEHYVYKYSPPAAIIFIPFILIGFPITKFIYWAFLTFILGHVLYLIKLNFLGDKINSKINGSLILAIAIVGTHFFRELHLGQVNILLLWLYVLALTSFHHKKPLAFGLIIALSLFIKPFGLIFIPFILLLGRYKEFLYMLAFWIVIFFSPLIFYPDLNGFIDLYTSWINELGIELGNKLDLLAAGNHTIFSVLARSTPLRYLHWGDTGRIIYQLVILAILGSLFAYQILKNKRKNKIILIFIMLIAIIPLLAFTSYNAFIFCLPLITCLMFQFGRMNIYSKIIFILSCLFIGANIYDLVGSKMFDLFWEISVYSWGTMGLLILVFLNWNKFNLSS